MGDPATNLERRGVAIPDRDGRGGMHAVCREFDWSATPIGAAATWPDWLRTAVRICLDSAFPSAVLWGPDFLQIYNDAVVPIFRDKHPSALGRPAPQVWAEAWPSIGPALEEVRRTGDPFTSEDMPVILERGGIAEEVFFTFGFSALRDDDGAVAGVLATGIETTEKVRAAAARLHAQESLRESEERLAALIEQLPLGVGVFDREGRWTLANETMRRYVRTRIPSADPGAGARWRGWDEQGRVLHTADFPGARALRGERVSGIDMLYTTDDGREIWTRVSAVPFRDPTGSVRAAIAMVQDIDREKRALEAVRISEWKFRAVSESGIVSIAFIDASGAITEANDAYLQMLGYAREDVDAGRLHWERFTPDEWMPRTRQALAELDATGRMTPYEKEFVRRDGERRWGLFTGARVSSTGIGVAFALDITERKRAECALRESEAIAAQRLEELEAIYRDAPVGLAVIDPALRYRHVNERLAAMNGVPAAAHIGRTVAEVVPHVASDIEAIARQVLETGQPVRDLMLAGETAARRGARRQWVSQWYPLRDATGGIVGINIVVDEVTERLRAEAALAETQRRLEEALATARMAYWDWDPETDRTVASASMADVCGLLPGAMLNSSAFGYAIMHPDDREAHRARVEAASARGEGWHGEFRIIRPRDGRIAWLEELATVTRAASGGAPHVTGMIWDITDRKRGEAAAEHERLERAREALRRQLASAEEDERRRLSRELHDQLGQHLTALGLGLDEARRHLAAGRSADERLAQLEVLAREMTRDARHLALELRPPELDDVGLESALASYIEQWKGRYGVAAELAVGVGSGSPLPSDVGTAVYRIVQEALTNVAKHAAATHVTVQLDIPDHEVRLVVEDDGRGFDPDVVAARAAAEGRLGLAGMRERVSLVGGTLELESAPGQGTTLYVRVPLAGG